MREGLFAFYGPKATARLYTNGRARVGRRGSRVCVMEITDAAARPGGYCDGGRNPRAVADIED
jgi:hypothetical protein